MWTSFLIGLTAGIAATPHCLGMCGGFPLYLADKSNGFYRQVLFVIGKCFTYCFLGTLAAAFGTIVFKNASLAPVAMLMRFALGVLVTILGLSMIGARLPHVKFLHGAADAGFVHSIFGGLSTRPTPLSAFILGIGVGFLPCPLPMGMLAVAAASHNTLQGIALMAGVGLGTAPGLLAVGLFGVGLDRKFTRIGMRAAGVFVLAIGLLTLGRATSAVLAGHHSDKPAPCCCQERVK